jgi:NAD(P)-dependent dehydrogenase (short-subunit alcohol dehydrogenase family)
MPTALVTGANRGIGLALCQTLAARGDQVIATCRRSSPALDQLGVRVLTGIDVADDASVASLRRAVDRQPIDILIHNAGVLADDSLSELDLERVRWQFEINALGPLRVTRALLDHLHRGAKIAIITSRMGSIADNGSGGSYGYRMSKAAVNMAGVSLARDLRPRGIAVALLHPGYVRTDMTGGHGNIDTSASAAGLVARIDELELDTSGSFWHASGEVLPW